LLAVDRASLSMVESNPVFFFTSVSFSVVVLGLAVLLR
jgi:hypothetical protein